MLWLIFTAVSTKLNYVQKVDLLNDTYTIEYDWLRHVPEKNEPFRLISREEENFVTAHSFNEENRDTKRDYGLKILLCRREGK